MKNRKPYIVFSPFGVMLLILIFYSFISANLSQALAGYVIAFSLVVFGFVAMILSNQNVAAVEVTSTEVSVADFSVSPAIYTLTLSNRTSNAAFSIFIEIHLGKERIASSHIEIIKEFSSVSVQIAALFSDKITPGFHSGARVTLKSRSPTGTCVAWKYFDFPHIIFVPFDKKSQPVLEAVQTSTQSSRAFLDRKAIFTNVNAIQKLRATPLKTPFETELEFVSFRKFSDRDSASKINWKKSLQTSTEFRNELLVNEYVMDSGVANGLTNDIIDYMSVYLKSEKDHKTTACSIFFCDQMIHRVNNKTRVEFSEFSELIPWSELQKLEFRHVHPDLFGLVFLSSGLKEVQKFRWTFKSLVNFNQHRISANS